MQLRSEVEVGAATWYWEAVHDVTFEQRRSEVAVGARASNCVSMSHVVSKLHTRFDVPVGAVSSYSHVPLQFVTALHTGWSDAA